MNRKSEAKLLRALPERCFDTAVVNEGMPSSAGAMPRTRACGVPESAAGWLLVMSPELQESKITQADTRLAVRS
jgi:hypothetical protein